MGHFDIQGTINGNVTCLGKLVVTGTINGNSESSEFFADASKIAGEVNCSGTVKIGAGSVIIGNITATSAVIAGAVKGDIDVHFSSGSNLLNRKSLRSMVLRRNLALRGSRRVFFLLTAYLSLIQSSAL